MTTIRPWPQDSTKYKTGVINDPLGQPTVQAGSDFHLILQYVLGRTNGRTCVNIVITTGRDCDQETFLEPVKNPQTIIARPEKSSEKKTDHLRPMFSSPQMTQRSEGNSNKAAIVKVT